ncbi:YhaN family protein [Paracoccus sp. (in: a-proteobacteria)]|uniref:ATP-binding protein n=1 Tax=Paracoccus sp. TaxID=267 RepID=UPI0026DF3E57|nr:YhaN family protein [Paracoccus sp. (in: a-proteobacteria)]MDO5648707.1 AAA family ATPase [Paracoccus sp. (in: a-proteobacteria)]
MRLDRLDLTRYGRFTDRSLAFAPPDAGGPDLHIIFGPNEAGKSTLFSAWLDLLFGIPTRSRYDFLHPGPTMQIGAQLSHAGTDLELKRLKRNNASLLDRHDAPVPETMLQFVLGGLSRDGYRAMFSLDDDTLEEGGDSILASRGDLGEMLFSASAGLSGLAPQLDRIRADLDGFHRTGKRSGWLYDAKKHLTELDQQRRRVEISANALQRLTRDAAAAESAWREARTREETTQDELNRLQELAGALPLQIRLAGLQARLAPVQDLPDADSEMQARFDQTERDRTGLNSRIKDRASRSEGLTQQLAALTPDPVALAQAERIDAAEALRPEHDTAVKDLPRRQADADTATAQMNALLAELGQHDAQPADLVIPAAQLSRMRVLLAQRSGLRTARDTAAAETRRADALLARERDRLGDPGPADDEAALESLLTGLRMQDPAGVRARAMRDVDQAQGRLDTALAALAPWRGDADMLAALAVPSDAHIAEWESAQESARQQQVDATREAADLRQQADQMQADADGRQHAQAATGITLADAAAARSQREALWAAHLRDLSAASAHAFEQALREDDRISSLLAEAMAEARRDALHDAALETVLARQAGAEARADAALNAQTSIAAAVAAACERLGLPKGRLAELKDWLDLRRQAVTERDGLRDAQASLQRSDDALGAAARALAAALDPAPTDDMAPFDLLLARATARLEASERRRDARAHLAALASDLRDREQAEKTAQDALSRWRDNWRDATRDSLLATLADDDAGLGATLDLLDRLGQEHRAAAVLTDRIDKMTANRDRFVAAKMGVLRALELADATPWADVLARLRRAQDNARDRQTLTQQIETEHQQDADDARMLAAKDRDIAALCAALAWNADDGTLADHLARCREATDLRREIALLTDDLRDRPTPAEGDDAETIRQQITTLKADQQLLRDEAEARHSAYLEARRQIEAVGGDDALARIAADRANLLLETRERATAHLAARFGLLAVEAGLRRYRDQHRSAMLARASDAFRQLSRGAYSGLAAQPDGAQEVLVALPAKGGAKRAADLSKGTRFQLYLALRVAGYHELAQSRPTVPFIADDIMETFDDGRSAAAFALLGDMSHVGQVIYLTHHRHLCDIALTACPGANIIEL